MDIADTRDATPIVQLAVEKLLLAAPTRGRPGSDLRTACGDLHANAELLLYNDLVGPPLVNCFELARMTGASHKQIAYVRAYILQQAPLTVGGLLVKNSIINLCLATEAEIIADVTFASRDDVVQLRDEVNAGFNAAEEVAADDMAQMTYRALVELHAAVIQHLVETARPLPRMLRFQFAEPQPTLRAAYRLYYDASRADELRAENKVVHPVFMRPLGRALSK